MVINEELKNKTLPEEHRHKFMAVLSKFVPVFLFLTILFLAVNAYYSREVVPPVVDFGKEEQGYEPPQTTTLQMPGSHPEKVRIPAIGVNAPTVDLNLKADKSLEVPSRYSEVGW